LAIEWADAAGAGAEAVDEPGEFVERGDLEDLEAAGFAGDPGSSGAGVDAWLARAALCRYCFRGSHNSNSIIGVGRVAEWGREERISLTPEGVSYRAGH